MNAITPLSDVTTPEPSVPAEFTDSFERQRARLDGDRRAAASQIGVAIDRSAVRVGCEALFQLA